MDHSRAIKKAKLEDTNDLNRGNSVVQPMPMPISIPSAAILAPVGPPAVVNWGDGMKWQDMNHITRVRYLTPRMRQSGRPDNVDDSFFYALPPAVKEPLSERRKEKMKFAVNIAVEEIKKKFKGYEENEKECKQQDEDASSSSDDSFDNFYTKKKVFLWNNNLSENDVIQFVKALPDHLTFTSSYDASGSDERHTELCHCPCSTKKSLQWLHLAGAVAMVEQMQFTACNKGPAVYRHFALLAHLRQFSDPLHFGVLVYVTELYTQHYGLLNHEALYKNVDDGMYNTVLAYKTRQFESKIADLREETRKWRDRRDNLMTENQEQKQEITKNREIFDKLKLTGKEKNRHVTGEEIQKLTRFYDAFRHRVLKRYRVTTNGSHCISSNEIPQPFNLSDLFDNWSKDPDDKSYLFINLADANFKVQTKVCRALLSPAEWNFGAAMEGVEKGIDEGGLTRAFLESVWQQAGKLSVKSNTTLVALFEEEACGLVPTPDEILRFNVACSFNVKVGELDGTDGAFEVLEKAQQLYRAFGRLMIHSLATNHILPWNLLPGIYRASVADLIGGKMPTEPDYPSTELFSHLKELNWRALDDDDNIRLHAKNNLIEGRSKCLYSIHQGLTLDDQFELQDFFVGRDIQVVDGILFASPDVTAAMIIMNLKGCKMVENARIDHLDPIQDTFLKETLPCLLRRKEAASGSEFLRAFLRHVTGLSYINRGKPTIDICFEQLGSQTALPVAHTCEQQLSFPLEAYDANVESLAYYLGKAIEYSAGDASGITMT